MLAIIFNGVLQTDIPLKIFVKLRISVVFVVKKEFTIVKIQRHSEKTIVSKCIICNYSLKLLKAVVQTS